MAARFALILGIGLSGFVDSYAEGYYGWSPMRSIAAFPNEAGEKAITLSFNCTGTDFIPVFPKLAGSKSLSDILCGENGGLAVYVNNRGTTDIELNGMEVKLDVSDHCLMPGETSASTGTFVSTDMIVTAHSSAELPDLGTVLLSSVMNGNLAAECKPGCLSVLFNEMPLANREMAWSTDECPDQADFILDVAWAKNEHDTIMVHDSYIELSDILSDLKYSYDMMPTMPADHQPIITISVTPSQYAWYPEQGMYQQCAPANLSITDNVLAIIPINSDYVMNDGGNQYYVPSVRDGSLKITFEENDCVICGGVQVSVVFDPLQQTNDTDYCSNLVQRTFHFECNSDDQSHMYKREAVEVFPHPLLGGDHVFFKTCYGWTGDIKLTGYQANENRFYNVDAYMVRHEMYQHMFTGSQMYSLMAKTMEYFSPYRKKRHISTCHYDDLGLDGFPDCSDAVHHLIEAALDMPEEEFLTDTTYLQEVMTKCPESSDVYLTAKGYSKVLDMAIEQGKEIGHFFEDYWAQVDYGVHDLKLCPNNPAVYAMFWHGLDGDIFANAQNKEFKAMSSFSKLVESQRKSKYVEHYGEYAYCEGYAGDMQCAYKEVYEMMRSPARWLYAKHIREDMVKDGMDQPNIESALWKAVQSHGMMMDTGDINFAYASQCPPMDPIVPYGRNMATYKVQEHAMGSKLVQKAVPNPYSQDANSRVCWCPISVLRCHNCHHWATKRK